MANKYGNVDKEIVPLLDALNSIPFVVTYDSCCGHGKREPHISLRFGSIKAIKIFYMIYDTHRASGLIKKWRIEPHFMFAYTKYLHMTIKGPLGTTRKELDTLAHIFKNGKRMITHLGESHKNYLAKNPYYKNGKWTGEWEREFNKAVRWEIKHGYRRTRAG